jgi:hypothetical protein
MLSTADQPKGKYMTKTVLSRAIVSVASIFLGLSAASAQQQATTLPAAQAPLYQGVMVDSKGKNVGRIIGINQVVREVNGIPVVMDANSSGFLFYNPLDVYDPANYYRRTHVFFKSADCTGAGFIDATDVPVYGILNTTSTNVMTFVYPGKPTAIVNVASARNISPILNPSCEPATGGPYGPILGPI